jgi:hypothetical protein
MMTRAEKAAMAEDHGGRHDSIGMQERSGWVRTENHQDTRKL